MGYPVALDASAEERETLGLTSITAYSKLFGSSANCTLQPPSIFSSSIMLKAAARNIRYSLSASVTAGAITILSPVCTPTGSRFSIEQTQIPLPLRSRITSNSISFQPDTLLSTNICPIGDAVMPIEAISLSSFLSFAIPPPLPPSVNAGRTITGYPFFSANFTAAEIPVAITEGTTG